MPYRRRVRVKTSTLVIAGSAIAAVVAVGIAAYIMMPTFLAASSPVERRSYDSWSDAPSRSQDPAAARPTWAPADATDIRLEYRVRNVPGYALSMRTADGLEPTACVRLDDAHGGPAMYSELLPDDLPDRPYTCGDGHAVWFDAGHVYAWSTVEPIDGAAPH